MVNVTYNLDGVTQEPVDLPVSEHSVLKLWMSINEDLSSKKMVHVVIVGIKASQESEGFMDVEEAIDSGNTYYAVLETRTNGMNS
ncbi:hypothetical protein GGI09_007225, partial [Coemansia sp. S100]